jgi:hypothetical protein
MAFTSGGGGGGGPMSEINVTPLVDVMLVLLIIFMVTAPLVQAGIKVDLPNAEAPEMPVGEAKLQITVGHASSPTRTSPIVVWVGQDAVPSSSSRAPARQRDRAARPRGVPPGRREHPLRDRRAGARR